MAVATPEVKVPAKAPAVKAKAAAPKTKAAKTIAKKVDFKKIFRSGSGPKAAGGIPTINALPDLQAPTVGGSLTIVVVVLIGAAVILIGSALDGSSISDTFRKIMAGDPINWSGTTAGAPAMSAAQGLAYSGITAKQPGPNKTCDKGWIYDSVTNMCIKPSTTVGGSPPQK